MATIAELKSAIETIPADAVNRNGINFRDALTERLVAVEALRDAYNSNKTISSRATYQYEANELMTMVRNAEQYINRKISQGFAKR